MMTSTSAEFTALKARLQATWMAGDFGQIAQYSEAVVSCSRRGRSVWPQSCCVSAALEDTS